MSPGKAGFSKNHQRKGKINPYGFIISLELEQMVIAGERSASRLCSH
jgi:hypothetical protein